MITSDLPLVEEILSDWRLALAQDYTPYRNHAYRVVHFCRQFMPLDELRDQQVQVAACFHDLGIWSDNTFDYLESSARRASDYLIHTQRSDWIVPVCAMIEDHHKITASPDPLTNAFRKADWVDVTLGQLRFGLPRERVAEIRQAFPNAGFHRLLVRLSCKQLLTRPWSPLPMMRW